MYKALCRFTTKTLCMCKDRNKLAHGFWQIYKAVCMPGIVI